MENDRGQHHLCRKITEAGKDMIRENTPTVTGPEGMTLAEKIAAIKRGAESRYDAGRNKKRNTAKP